MNSHVWHVFVYLRVRCLLLATGSRKGQCSPFPMPWGAESLLLLAGDPPATATPNCMAVTWAFLAGLWKFFWVQSWKANVWEVPGKLQSFLCGEESRVLHYYLLTLWINKTSCIGKALALWLEVAVLCLRTGSLLQGCKMKSWVCSYGCTTIHAQSPVGNCSRIKQMKYQQLGFTCLLLV